MQTQSVNSCKNRYDAISKNLNEATTPKVKSDAMCIGEVAIDDYESLGFQVFDNNTRSQGGIEKWAKETNELAWKSIFFHIVELPLKVISYFVSNSDSSDSFWSRGFTAADRLAGTLGGMYRNSIYGRDDDNMGAVNKAKEIFGDTKTQWFTKWNIIIQTKARFLVPALSLISPELANDLDWGVIGAIDSSWWRKMSLNSGFYPGIVQDLLTKWKNLFTDRNKGRKKEGNKDYPPSWRLVTDQFTKHWESAKAAWNSYKNESNQESKDKKLLAFCKYMDQTTSVIMPFICLPSNLVGDTVRPLLRRLNLTGTFRNIIRTLSVSDRALLGINYVFRFLIPEKTVEKKQGITTPFKSSNLYLASLVGDVLDLPLTIFEDKIKESHPFIQHSIELMRIAKESAFNLFWSGRRISRTSKILQNPN